MKKTILEYSICTAACLLIGFLICVFEGIFGYSESFRILGILCDAFFIPGIFAFGVGVLIFVANNGVFDMLIYGVSCFIGLFKKDPTKRKYATFYDYHVARAERVKTDCLYLIVVGGTFIIIAAILLIFWNNAYQAYIQTIE